MSTLEDLADAKKLASFVKDVASAVEVETDNIPSALNGGVELTPEGFSELIKYADKPTDEECAERMRQFDP
jgi:hypothetical protein